jgi:hypothetical protein
VLIGARARYIAEAEEVDRTPKVSVLSSRAAIRERGDEDAGRASHAPRNPLKSGSKPGSVRRGTVGSSSGRHRSGSDKDEDDDPEKEDDGVELVEQRRRGSDGGTRPQPPQRSSSGKLLSSKGQK